MLEQGLTARVAGHRVAAIDREQTANRMCRHALRRRRRDGERPGEYTSINGQVVALAAKDGMLRKALDRADLISCDSQPIVFFTRLFGRVPLPERVATTDLIHDVAREAVRHGVTFYLFGATEDTNRAAAAGLRRLHPGLAIVGRRNGYFTRGEEADVCREISRSRPDILWVGLGVPLEQDFLTRNIESLDVGIVKTSGGCFKILAGEISRAPKIVQSIGFEWLGRVLYEPRHVLGRYLSTSPQAIWLTLRGMFLK